VTIGAVRKAFFSEEKKQKTFVSSLRAWPGSIRERHAPSYLAAEE
jgi:hypothetical protein